MQVEPIGDLSHLIGTSGFEIGLLFAFLHTFRKRPLPCGVLGVDTVGNGAEYRSGERGSVVEPAMSRGIIGFDGDQTAVFRVVFGEVANDCCQIVASSVTVRITTVNRNLGGSRFSAHFIVGVFQQAAGSLFDHSAHGFTNLLQCFVRGDRWNHDP